MDQQIDALLTELNALGLADSTIVIYTSDHGEVLSGGLIMALGIVFLFLK